MHTGRALTISSRPLAIQVGQLRVRIYVIFFSRMGSDADTFSDIDPYLYLL
jgi:hypothetical protein